MKSKLKKVSITFGILIIGIIIGIVMPIIVKGENTDANAAQVLAGKTFTSSLVSVATSGKMKNLSGKTFATNNPGVSTIDVDDGYYTEIQVDASEVYQAGVTAGQTNGSKVYYLGEGTSFDLSTIFPEKYQSLTNDNFIVAAFSASRKSSNGYTHRYENSTASAYVAGFTIASSYDNTTGVLTITGNSQNLCDYGGGRTLTTTTQPINCKAYCVFGTIQDAPTE